MRSLFIPFFLLSTSCFALEWESGTKKVNLVELYTSESCSSCPPAEKWLNGLKDESALYKKIVPVEYHVDYWNYLSWTDKHSDNSYTRRQRSFAQKRGTSVFTPQILHNGKTDLRYSADYPLKQNENAPSLKINLDQEKGVVNLSTDYAKKFICEASITKGGFVSKVKAGENSGKTLRHEFVVQELQTVLSNNKKCRFDFKNLKSEKDKGIAIWIRSPETFEVIQATGYRLN